VIATGRNRRVQQCGPIARGEMDCPRAAGRRRICRSTTLHTTLSPCMMCAGTIVRFGMPRVVAGENATFGGNEDSLRSRGVEVVVLDGGRCEALMRRARRRGRRTSRNSGGGDRRRYARGHGPGLSCRHRGP
jgi:cytosine deaminase